MNTLERNFKENVKLLRKSRGYTQAQIAFKLDVSRHNYQQWESGSSTPGYDDLNAICQFGGVSIDDFLTTNIQPRLESAELQKRLEEQKQAVKQAADRLNEKTEKFNKANGHAN